MTCLFHNILKPVLVPKGVRCIIILTPYSSSCCSAVVTHVSPMCRQCVTHVPQFCSKSKISRLKYCNFIQKSGLSRLGENISQSEHFFNLATLRKLQNLKPHKLCPLYGAYLTLFTLLKFNIKFTILVQMLN